MDHAALYAGSANKLVMLYQLAIFAAFGFVVYYFRAGIMASIRRVHAILTMKLRTAFLLALLLVFVARPAMAWLELTTVPGLFLAAGEFALGTVTGPVADAFEGVYSALFSWFADLICLLIEFAGPGVIATMDGIPTGLAENTATIVGYLQIANYWAPLAEGAIMFAAYLTFLSIQIPFKLFMKLFIPTVG